MATKVKTGEQWLEIVNSGNTALVKTFAKKFHGIVDENGNTALILAVKKGFTDMIPILVPLEARKKDVEGYTALMHAIKAGDAKSCELLVSAEHMDTLEDGCNVLMLSLEREMLNITQILLPYFTLAPDSNGLTPIDYALCNDNLKGLKLLLEKYNPAPETIQQSIKSAQDQGRQAAADILTTYCSTYQPRPADDEASDSKSDSSSLRGSKKLKVKAAKPAKPAKKEKGKGSTTNSTSSSMVESVDDSAPHVASPTANELVLPLEAEPDGADNLIYVKRIPTPGPEDNTDIVKEAPLTVKQLIHTGTNLASMSNEQLKKRITELERENARLREENARLRAGAGEPLTASVVTASNLHEQVSDLVLQLSQTNERLVETIALSESLYNTGKV